MGSLCSKHGSHSGVHSTVQPTRIGAGTLPPLDPRAAAAAAAEQRLKAAQARGTNASNPNQGKLAAQISKHNKFIPEAKPEERLVWD